MKKFFLNALVSEHDENYYFLVSNGKKIIVPIKVMHQRCVFSGLTDSKGLIKNGTQLNLVEINTDNGTVFYPNHNFYLNNNIREEQQRIAVGSFHIKQFTYGVENDNLEFKTSFACISDIKETIAAFANTGHEGTILVGVNDDGTPKGLHGHLTANEKQNLTENIRNQIKVETDSLEFSQTLLFQWETRNGLTICRIIVPAWTGDIIFLHKEKLHVRMNATNQRLIGRELVRFIEERCQKIAVTTN